jgi:hypothetical protein
LEKGTIPISTARILVADDSRFFAAVLMLGAFSFGTWSKQLPRAVSSLNKARFQQ